MASNFYWKAGSVLGLTALALGAFGAHGLAKHVNNDQTKIRNWTMAAEFQLMHGVALLALSSIPSTVRRIHPAASPLILGGTIMFSGTIYLLTLKREQFRALGPVTPLGGLAMMAGWATLLL
ncbi:uncharacterized protein BYT42DRAFT_545034 [Radiomyces spectabilis]|uniref:uncharacterized protein n=1 Tax=Radiomyces spectabilis TaxID=64574 RepID=UPI002220C83F|nr:uncharacterized protein BYT42DRAFT_545034 [Radiomyces spectabilis]KAI8381083.1 hypothetical protein BYT42DRAFT_545034 [Radiomyces spectabilis]